MKTWSDLLDALRQGNAYEGDGSLADVQKFLTDNDIKVMGDLAGLFTRSKKGKAVMVRATAGEEIQIEEPEMAAEMAEGEDEKPMMEPKKATTPARKSTPHRIPSFNAGSNRTKAMYDRYTARQKMGDRLSDRKRTVWGTPEQAHAFKSLLRFAAGKGNSEDAAVLNDYLGQKAGSEYLNTAGGFAVPEEFASTLIDLREEYGVIKPLCNTMNMSRDVLWIPRRTAGFTVYQVGENSTITDTTPTGNNVELVAKKWAAYGKSSTELLEDADLSIADWYAREFAYAFAVKEDQCILRGDQTQTYLGVLGIEGKFRSLVADAGGTWASGNQDYAGGLVIGAGNLWSELTLANFQKVAGRLPTFPGMTPKWICSQPFFYEVMQRLQLAAGGAMVGDFEGGTKKMFLGHEVVISQAMPTTEADDQLACLFGDLSFGVAVGNRRDLEISMTDQRFHDTDQIGWRATERIAINVHDVGNASSTAANRSAGPIVGLVTATS